MTLVIYAATVSGATPTQFQTADVVFQAPRSFHFPRNPANVTFVSSITLFTTHTHTQSRHTHTLSSPMLNRAAGSSASTRGSADGWSWRGVRGDTQLFGGDIHFWDIMGKGRGFFRPAA